MALLIFALLFATFGQTESPTCKLSDQAKVVSVVTFPCADGDHLVEISSVGVHLCDCNVLMVPTSVLTADISPVFLLYPAPLQTPHTAITAPSTPPPRLV